LEPTLVAQVKDWSKGMTEDQAKKLFIRSEALKAYKENRVEANSMAIIGEIIDSISVSGMSKDNIALHIGQLERARALLAALTQGYEIAYAEEKEPEFRAKHEKEAKEAKATRKPGDTLSKLGISKEELLAALAEIRSNKNPAPIIANPPTPTPTPIQMDKTTCEHCQKEFLTKMKSFHKC
jgi:hypothetical protein